MIYYEALNNLCVVATQGQIPSQPLTSDAPCIGICEPAKN
jgi:hypothetical protein